MPSAHPAITMDASPVYAGCASLPNGPSINGQAESHVAPGIMVRALNVGGNWNNGSNAGVGYANSNNSVSNSNNNIGARLTYVPSILPLTEIIYSTVTSASPLGETKDKPQVRLVAHKAKTGLGIIGRCWSW